MRMIIVTIGIVVSSIFLYLAAKEINVSELILAFRRAEYVYLILGVSILLTSYILRALEWQILIGPVKVLRIRKLLSAIMIGFMANNIMPARLGEFVRAYAIGESKEISRTFALATIAIERLFDLFVLLIFLEVALVFSDFPKWIKHIGYNAGVILLATMLLIGSLTLAKKRAVLVLKRVLSRFPDGFSERVIYYFDSFFVAFHLLQNWRRFVLVGTLSIANWCLWCFALLLTLIALNIDIPSYGIILLVSVLNLGGLIPSVPGYVGTYQFLTVKVLGLFAIASGNAFGFSIVFHALWYLPQTLLGFWFLGKENLSLIEIGRSREEIVKSKRLQMRNGAEKLCPERKKPTGFRQITVDE